MYVTRTGGLYPPRGASCDVTFERTQAGTAMAQYEQVGMITFAGSNAAELDQELRDRVRTEACKLGGNVVIFNTATGAGMASNSQFLVFSKPAPSEEKSAPQSL